MCTGLRHLKLLRFLPRACKKVSENTISGIDSVRHDEGVPDVVVQAALRAYVAENFLASDRMEQEVVACLLDLTRLKPRHDGG